MAGKRVRRFSVREADLPEIRKYIETTEIDVICDGMRKVVEREMPDLVHKLPPLKKARGGNRP